MNKNGYIANTEYKMTKSVKKTENENLTLW